jgi:purine-binding chemotaxis protein CheW
MPFGIFVSLKHMDDVQRIRLVVFRVGELACAVPAAIVREVISQQPATRIPGASAEVDGLFNVRGTLLTVFDGRRMLEQQGSADADGSVLVIETNGRTVGLGVDEVLDLVEVPADSLDQREALPGVDPRLARAVGRAGDRVFAVLDTDALLAPLLT